MCLIFKQAKCHFEVVIIGGGGIKTKEEKANKSRGKIV